LKGNPPRKQEAAMSMYFVDDTDDWPEYQTIRDEIHRLDKEHLELRKELAEAESAVKCDPANQDLKAKIDGLNQKLQEIERKLDESLSMYR
jgi:hypothetical protein